LFRFAGERPRGFHLTSIQRIHTSSDPLVREPVRIVNRDYVRGALVLTLNHEVPQGWAVVFHDIHAVPLGPAWNLEPSAVRFEGNKVRLPIHEEGAPEAFTMFQQWLDRANQFYAERDRERRAEDERAQSQELEQQLREAERRWRVLERLPAP
jgi:hypothetical protein